MASHAQRPRSAWGFQPLRRTTTPAGAWSPPRSGVARVSLPLTSPAGAVMTVRSGPAHGTVVVVWPASSGGTLRVDRLDRALVRTWWFSDQAAAALGQMECDWPANHHDYLVGSREPGIRLTPCSECLLHALGAHEPRLARSLRADVECLRMKMEHL